MYLIDAEGRPARALKRIAVRHRADALVLGAPRHRMWCVPGSVPVQLIRHARCPVIVVP